MPVEATPLCKRAGVGGELGEGGGSERGEGCSRRASDPEILRGFSARRWKMCNTFHRQGFLTPQSLLCWFFFFFAREAEQFVRRHLTDESGGGALSNPEAELPLLPLPQLSFRAGGDEHGVLVDQRLVKNLESKREKVCTNVKIVEFCLVFFVIVVFT